jgi:hypothetical protein
MEFPKLFFGVCYALVTRLKTLSRLKQSVLNGSNILRRRINDDCGNERVLNFDIVANKQK